MTEHTDARELREKCIRRAELLRSTGFTGDASTADLLERAAAALEKADDLRAENARLREAMADLVSWFDGKPEPAAWRIPAGEYGADDAVAHVRNLLSTPAPAGREEGGDE